MSHEAEAILIFFWILNQEYDGLTMTFIDLCRRSSLVDQQGNVRDLTSFLISIHI